MFAVHSSEDPVNESRIEAYDFETGETKLIMEAAGNPVYARTGHLLFARGSTLMAAPFDEVALVVTGAAFPVVESIYMADPSGSMNFTISNDGTLAYTPEGNNPPHSTIVSVDRSGRESSILDTARDFEGPRLSPDGQRIAVSLADADGGRDVWILDRTRGNLSRLTFDRFASEIVWRSDGERLAFAALGGGLAYNAFSTSADGSGEPEPLTFERRVVWPTSFTPDGAGLILSVLASHHKDIGYMELGTNAEMKYLLETDFDEISPRLSPDGRWLAYVSDESGEREVYAQRFPDGGDKKQVSVNSGTEPVWSANGEELFFREAERMMVVSISSANRLTLGTPTVLFEGPYLPAWSNSLSANYDVSADGEEFIMLRPEGGTLRQEIVIVLNWFDELERLVPTDH